MAYDGIERRQVATGTLSITQLERYIDEVHTLTLRHDTALYGIDGRNGLSRDVDRLAQMGKIAIYMITPTTVAVVALVVNQFGKLIFRY